MKKGKKAFTLAEIMVCVVLFSGLIIVVSSMYSFVRRTFMRSDGKAAAAAEIERLLLHLDSELRSAREVVVPSSDARSESLVFYDKEGNQIGYEFSKGQVVRTRFADRSKKIVLEQAEMMAFSRFSPGLVEIVVSSRKVSVLSAVHVWNLP
jgi:type II secretory pathway component PulJ